MQKLGGMRRLRRDDEPLQALPRRLPKEECQRPKELGCDMPEEIRVESDEFQDVIRPEQTSGNGGS